MKVFDLSIYIVLIMMLTVFKLWAVMIISIFCVPYHCCCNINNTVIVEYFLYKKSPSIIGFTDNEGKSKQYNFELVRKFSEFNVKSVLFKLERKMKFLLTAKKVYWKIGIFIDLRCHSSGDIKFILSEATDYRMFDESYHWFIIGTSLNESLELINDTSFGLSTDFVIAVSEENNYILYDIYNPCKIRGGTLNTTLLGTWNANSGFHIIIDYKKMDRWNLQGMNLKISGLVNDRPDNIPLMEHLVDHKMKQLDSTAKFTYELWIHLAEMFNFTLSYIEKRVWEKGDKNGPVMNAVHKGEADASGSPATITTDRLNSGRPIYPAIPFRSCFFFRSTSSNKINLSLILEPLAPTVWYLIILFGVISVNVMVLLSISTETRLGVKYMNSIMINVSAFCQQGTDLTTQRWSGRVAIFHIFVFNLLLNNYYMASVVSTRLNNPFKKINDSLNQLKKADFAFASEKSLYFDFYMKRNDYETRSFYVNKWLKVPENKRFMTKEQALPLVLHGGFAYHTLPEVAYPYIERFFDLRKICELTEVHLVRPTQLSIFVHMNSSFTEMMKVGFAKITEAGIRNRQIKRWFARKPQCRVDVLTIDKVTVYEIAPALIFLTLSIVLSGIVLGIEKIISLK